VTKEVVQGQEEEGMGSEYEASSQPRDDTYLRREEGRENWGKSEGSAPASEVTGTRNLRISRLMCLEYHFDAMLWHGAL
jgi:hypothetical protein